MDGPPIFRGYGRASLSLPTDGIRIAPGLEDNKRNI
jgi:hypothetical protein